jgi:coenzyme F420-reducing hydrogenase alpha subunit
VPASIAAAYRQRLAAARLACAALAGGQPFPLAAAGDSGRGVAQVLTARGVLTHAVSVDNALVTRYRVLAPTDESFATAAPLAGLLAGQRFALPAEARRALEQAILALDPCLPHAVELHDA